MRKKHLEDLLKNIPSVKVTGNKNIKLDSLAWDSRKVVPGSLFFALKGVHTDGHRFIEEAVKKGARGIVHSDPLPRFHQDISYIQVPDTRRSLSPMAAAWWENPSKDMTIIGVTGTDGKSTTVSLIRQLLEREGVKVGQLSTVNFKITDKEEKNSLRQSTPEALEIQEFLSAMRQSGKDHAVLEATSHGLSPRNSRLADVAFDAGVFTNVTQEHLEFHGSLEQYRSDKAELFRMIARSPSRDAFGVVNGDDPWAELFIEAAGEKPVFTYSLKNQEADLMAADLKPDPTGTSFTLHTPLGNIKTRINLPNLCNVENVLAAVLTVAELRDEYPRDLAERLPALKGIKGRMEKIQGDMPFTVMVDYAHSTGSFRRFLPFLKEMTRGRLLVLFGSAGERDLEKRPQQGALADTYADFIVLTDEDPRGEDSLKILQDIAGGITKKKQGEDLLLIPNRQEAMREIFSRAREGDLVVTLGKGHEESIIYPQGPRPWDEAEACREALRALGWEA